MKSIKRIVTATVFLLIGQFTSLYAIGAERGSPGDVNPTNSLGVDLKSLKQHLSSSVMELETVMANFDSCNKEECSHEPCEGLDRWRQRVFSGLDDMRREMTEVVGKDIVAQNMDDTIVSAIDDQRSTLEAIESNLAEIPSALNYVNELIQAIKTSQAPSRPMNCLEAKAGGGVTGVTTIYPGGVEKSVKCDQDTEGGGWTVLLLRQKQKPQVQFRQSFELYKRGFGNPSGEYWIGLTAMRDLTEDLNELLVTMAVGKETASSYYTMFRVDANYKLRVDGYDNARSTGGDSLARHNNWGFTTHDRDRDGASGGNCADWCGGGGWWYDHCYTANPTGRHPGGRTHGPADHFIEWRSWKGKHKFMSDLVMMVRPKQS